MIKVYTGFKGFAATLFFIAGAILFMSVFFWGVTKAIQLILPLLIVLSYLLIFVFLLGILPATFVKNLRPSLIVYSLLMSYVLGASTWMMSFFFVVKSFGGGGIFLALLFQFLAPIALVSAVLKSSWHIAGHLALWISFTYGMKFYSQWLSQLNPPRHQDKSNIIDVDAVEIKER